jgi:hypothetical protein
MKEGDTAKKLTFDQLLGERKVETPKKRWMEKYKMI